MERIFDEIANCQKHGLPHASLIMTLAIPDICANLSVTEEAKEKGQKARYIKWFDSYAKQNIDFITGNDCWCIRCGVVHKGRIGNKDQKFDRVVFTYASADMAFSMRSPDKNYGRFILLSLSAFSRGVIDAAKNWLSTKRDDRMVQRNLELVVKSYPHGFPLTDGVTLMSGVPCIA